VALIRGLVNDHQSPFFVGALTTELTANVLAEGGPGKYASLEPRPEFLKRCDGSKASFKVASGVA